MMRSPAGACLAANERTSGSSAAAPAAATPLMNPRRSVRYAAAMISAHYAGRGMPLRSVRQFLEVVVDDVGLVEEFGIVDELGECQVDAAVRHVEQEEVLLEHGVRRVGHPV